VLPFRRQLVKSELPILGSLLSWCLEKRPIFTQQIEIGKISQACIQEANI